VRPVAGVVVLALLASACRAPGEPPTHPGRGEYQDLIRRELASLQTAQSSTRLLLRYAARGDIPGNYGIVVLRQNATDLSGIVTDLREVQPPGHFAPAHHRLLRLAQRDATLVDRLTHAWNNDPLKLHARKTLGDDADTVTQTLEPELVG
jgi:hypothetical protein